MAEGLFSGFLAGAQAVRESANSAVDRKVKLAYNARAQGTYDWEMETKDMLETANEWDALTRNADGSLRSPAEVRADKRYGVLMKRAAKNGLVKEAIQNPNVPDADVNITGSVLDDKGALALEVELTDKATGAKIGRGPITNNRTTNDPTDGVAQMQYDEVAPFFKSLAARAAGRDEKFRAEMRTMDDRALKHATMTGVYDEVARNPQPYAPGAQASGQSAQGAGLGAGSAPVAPPVAPGGVPIAQPTVAYGRAPTSTPGGGTDLLDEATRQKLAAELDALNGKATSAPERPGGFGSPADDGLLPAERQRKAQIEAALEANEKAWAYDEGRIAQRFHRGLGGLVGGAPGVGSAVLNTLTAGPRAGARKSNEIVKDLTGFDIAGSVERMFSPSAASAPASAAASAAAPSAAPTVQVNVPPGKAQASATVTMGDGQSVTFVAGRKVPSKEARSQAALAVAMGLMNAEQGDNFVRTGRLTKADIQSFETALGTASVNNETNQTTFSHDPALMALAQAQAAARGGGGGAVKLGEAELDFQKKRLDHEEAMLAADVSDPELRKQMAARNIGRIDSTFGLGMLETASPAMGALLRRVNRRINQTERDESRDMWLPLGIGDKKVKIDTMTAGLWAELRGEPSNSLAEPYIAAFEMAGGNDAAMRSLLQTANNVSQNMTQPNGDRITFEDALKMAVAKAKDDLKTPPTR